jgi:uncharacterized protein YjbI with pentapeptide repeats
MANPEHLAILKEGVNEWNRWKTGQSGLRPDFSGADLSGFDLNEARLHMANFKGANLDGTQFRRAYLAAANLSGANLSKAMFLEANMSFADLSSAFLTQCDFSSANLNGADLSGADLDKANLYEADLRTAILYRSKLNKANLYKADLTMSHLLGAYVTYASVGLTSFASVDLSGVEGLGTVVHSAPSSIGIDTIYKSKGKIPEVFLRGCGVPEEFIAYIGSMVGRPIEYYSCFISYSTKDQAFADRLYADLQAKGVRCWFAPHDIRGGRKIHEQIDEAIRVHDKLLLILSEHSMASDWVGTEIANAREREAREKKQMLFPITLAPFEEVKQWKKFDADRGTDSAREIREYYIPDFSGWERDSAGYAKEFERLVTALKSGASG